MVSPWIARNRKPLRVLWVVLVLICAAELIGLRQLGEITPDRAAFVLFFTLPFFLFGAVHLALMYGSWFLAAPVSGFTTTVKRSIFWMTFVAFAIVVIGFVGRFGLQVW